jgi:hypothetical protein
MSQVKNKFLAQMATNTLKGNNTGSTHNPIDLTVAQVNAILPVFTSSLNGLAPSSGGGSSNFLRADGTWAAPAGTGGYWTASGANIYNNNAGFVGFYTTVTGDVTSPWAPISLGVTTTFSQPAISMGDPTAYRLDIGYANSYNEGWLQAYEASTSAYGPIALSPLGGGVGIGLGTASPSALLEVGGTSLFDGTLTMSGSNAIVGNLINMNGANTFNGFINIGQTQNAFTPAITAGQNNYELDYGFNYGHNLGFLQAYNGVGVGSVLALNPLGGNVGIGLGTTAPSALFEVNGTSQFDGILTMSGNNAIVGNQINLNSPTSNVAPLTFGVTTTYSIPSISMGQAASYERGDIGYANSYDMLWLQSYGASSVTYKGIALNPLGGGVTIGNGTSQPTGTLDVNGITNLRGALNMNANPINVENILLAGLSTTPTVSYAPITIGVNSNYTQPQIWMGNANEYALAMGYANSYNAGWLQAYNSSTSVYDPLQLEPLGGGVGINLGTTAPATPLDVGGAATIRGALDMNTHQIHNVVDPTSAQDAATKNYVDTSLLHGLTTDGVIYATGAGTVTSTAAGTNGYPLVANTSAAPTFQVLPIVGGGTNNTSLPVTAGGVIYTDGTRLQNSGAGTAGQILQSNGSSAPTFVSPIVSAISSTAIDWSLVGFINGLYTKTLGANITLTFSNAVAGQTIVIRLTNTASNYTVTWPTIRWSGGTAPTMSPGAVSDIYTIIYDGTNYYGAAVQNMS